MKNKMHFGSKTFSQWEDASEPPQDGMSNGGVRFSILCIALGHLDFEVSSEQGSISALTEVIDCNPLFDLTRFVRALQEGKQAHIGTTQAGTVEEWIGFHAWPQEDGKQVRFIMRHNPHGPALDTMCGLEDLSHGLHGLLRRIADHPFFPHQYVVDLDEPAYEKAYDATAEAADQGEDFAQGHEPPEGDYDPDDLQEFFGVLQRVELLPEDQERVAKYQRMLRTLEIPPEWEGS